jgi:hypothetical protein
MGQKRDLTGIEVRSGRRETPSAHTPRIRRAPGGRSPVRGGTYEEAVMWRKKVLAIKQDAKRRKQEQRTDETLARIESALRDR